MCLFILVRAEQNHVHDIDVHHDEHDNGLNFLEVVVFIFDIEFTRSMFNAIPLTSLFVYR